MRLRLNLADVAQIILDFYLIVFQSLEHIQVFFFVIGRYLARILHYKKDKSLWHKIFPLKEDNMATRRKLTLINGTIDQEYGLFAYRTTNSSEVHCLPYPVAVPLAPFPDDDDDRDNFDQAE